MAQLLSTPVPTRRPVPRPVQGPPIHEPAHAPIHAPVHAAEALCGPGGLARIVLAGQVYTLRITRAGKLILTK